MKFLMEQITNSYKPWPDWLEPTLREYVLLKASFLKFYDHEQGKKLLKLPCQSMLQKLFESSRGDTDETRLIKKRLQVERQSLRSEQESIAA